MTSGLARDADTIVVGAGIAGLAAAARLAHAGRDVLVVDRAAAPGGKMRTLPSEAGPVDAGPTVLTLRPVFEALFADLGERLGDHVTLIRQPVLARHFWADGSTLDLHDDREASARAIRTFSGARSEREFRAFAARARRLFEGLDGAVMRAPVPSLLPLMRRPGLLGAMAPLSSLAGSLARQFSDPRLAQLFGRYATYVGGSPYRSPALLSLISEAEAAGVWSVAGGMHRLAAALADLAAARGATFLMNTHVERIETSGGHVTGLRLADGGPLRADTIVFNGDPRALASGALGPDTQGIAPQSRRLPRSLSAEVWAFAARASGPALSHHNVFFRDDPRPEFDALHMGRFDPDPTLYVCAMDRGPGPAPTGPERFEIIANAPDLTRAPSRPATEEYDRCQSRTFPTLARFGLSFDRIPGPEALTTPSGFETLFPASAGALYGQSPHGLMAAFRRPTARTAIKGLYLAGGGTHPGAGVPMATLSGRHAAEAILQDRTSTSRSPRTAMPGGTSTGSATAAGKRSASSPS